MRKPNIGIAFYSVKHKIGPFTGMKLKLCYAEGIDIVFFFPEDVDYEKKCVNAYVWTPNGFVRELVELPYMVECGACLPAQRQLIAEHCEIIDDFTLSKKEIDEMLIKSRFAECVIPAIYTAKPDMVLKYLVYWGEIIVKPLVGARGEGIVCIKPWQENTYCFTYPKGDKKYLSYNDAVELITEMYNRTTVIVQPRLHFLNKDGNTMDFRVNVSKGEGGKWTTVFILPRTGRESVVSNLSQGGYAGLIEPVLMVDYGDKADSVLEMLNDIAENLPPLVEKASNCNMLSLGIDVGIDYDTLKPYIIEVNYVPQVHFHKAEYINTQVAYFKYLDNQLRESADVARIDS